MLKRFRRSDMMDTVIVNGREECDMLRTKFDLFKLKREARFYRIVGADIGRPDLLSQRLYGIQDYWWVIGKVNNIDDWWNDLTIDTVIQVPHVQDIEDWFAAARRKR
jgi:hypothetical protein